MKTLLATLLMILAGALPALAQAADETAKRFHVFPQLADGGGFQSLLLVTNVALSESRCALTLHGELTTDRLRAPAATESHPVDLVSDSIATFRLSHDDAPFIWPTTNESDLAVGYATLDCTDLVVAQVLYVLNDPSSGTTAGMATVFSSPRAAVFQFPVLAQDTTLGIAIANDGFTDTSCELVLESQDRTSAGDAAFAVLKKSSLAKFLHEVVPLPAGFNEGSVTVSCDQQVSMIGLLFDGSIFTTLPPVILSIHPASDTPADPDREVLEAFYDATDGPNWNQSDNWKTAEELGQWHGVRTDANGRVILLSLGGNYLSGPIPAELSRLTRLEELNLDNNELSGPIPAELGSLINLVELNLNQNELSGPIPPELENLINLESLNLHGNKLSGPIAAELGTLINLESLDLNNNELSGPIPPELGELTRLQKLVLYRNELSGPIPAELGKLTRLRELELWDNQLNGTVSAELGKLINLRRLLIENNRLSGRLPSALTNLSRLDQFTFHNNAGLCAPSDEEFQNWLNGISEVGGPTCNP